MSVISRTEEVHRGLVDHLCRLACWPSSPGITDPRLVGVTKTRRDEEELSDARV
jgi:hypothetical protein